MRAVDQRSEESRVTIVDEALQQSEAAANTVMMTAVNAAGGTDTAVGSADTDIRDVIIARHRGGAQTAEITASLTNAGRKR
jgi:hypothetical protein